MGNAIDISPAPAEGNLAPSPAHRRERAAVRNVTLLLLFRGVIMAGGVTSAALVPRTMGPATYGRYDLITMLTFLFSMMGGIGMGQVTSRQTPELEAKGATDKLHSLFGGFLVMRTLSSTTVAILYLIVTRLWLQDLDWTILCLLSVAVLLRGPASLCYSLFLGQGRIGRWALPEVLRQWGSVVCSLPCYLLGGLRGAVFGYLITETVIFTLAFVGARRAMVRHALRLNLREIAPLLRIGVVFWTSELVVSAFDRSGAVLIRSLTSDYAQVGLFGVSFQIFMAAVLSTLQISNSFVPIITVLRSRHEEAELKRWIQRLAKWLAVLAVLGFFGSVLLGREVIPLVLGRAYEAVVPNMIALAAAMLLLPLLHVCSLLCLTHDRPGTLLKAALLKLSFFWVLGIPLVMRWGSLGACMSVCSAFVVQAGYMVFKNRAEVGPAFVRWGIVIVTGLLFVPLAWLRSSPAVNITLFLVAAGGFLLILRGLGVVSTRELGAVYHSLVAARAARRANGGGAT